jgi:hypothetical protein
VSYSSAETKLYNETLKKLGGKNRILLKQYQASQERIETQIAKYRQDIESGRVISDFTIPRQEALLAQVNAEIAELHEIIKAEIDGGFTDIYTGTYYNHAYNIEAALNTELSTGSDYVLNFPQINSNAARAALEMPIGGHTFTERIAQDQIVMQFKLRGLVSQTIIEGRTRKQLTMDLLALDDAFAASLSKAETTARTELLRAYSYGQDLSRLEAEAAGVEFKYKWSAALDGKTRSDHAAMDNTYADIVDGEPVFTLPDGSQAAGPRMEGLSAKESINCRCRRLDLPFGIEPTVRAGKLPDGTYMQVPGHTTADEWRKKYYGN